MGQDKEEQTGGAGLGNGGRDRGREETLTAQADLGTLGGLRAESQEQPRATEAQGPDWGESRSRGLGGCGPGPGGSGLKLKAGLQITVK